MKVLIIPEDPRLDQYMLKPLVKAALEFAGKANPKVMVCQESSLRGDSTIIHFDAIKEVIEFNLLYDAFILCVDRDCRETRPDSLQTFEKQIREAFPNKKFVAVCGIEELEVWLLAGMEDLEEAWDTIRKECHPKETYFEPYVERRKLGNGLGKGRQRLGEEAAKRYSQWVRQLCPEIQACEMMEP